MPDPTDIDALAAEFGSGKVTTKPNAAVTSSGIDIDALAREFGSGIKTGPSKNSFEPTEDLPLSSSTIKKAAGGLIRGGLDVGETVAENALKLASTAAPLFYKSDTADAIRKYKEETIAENKAERDKFAAENPSLSPGDIGRMGGQILTTLPMFPGRVARSIDVAAGALPTTLPSGVTVAAPLARRLGATIATGATAGAEFGALTSPGEEVGGALKGMVTGAVAGPLAAGAAKLGEWGVRGIKNMLWNNEIKNLVLESGIDAKAAKRVVYKLDQAGYTPEEALAEVKRLGPDATLLDLDPSLVKTGRALTQFGEQPDTILSNTMRDRAAKANVQAKNIIETKLGPKPDIEAERQAIINDARTATGPDYKIAYNSGQQLDVAPVVADIDNQLKTVVGKRESLLKEIKGYFYRDVTDAQGNVTKQLKTDLPSLHAVREELDGIMEDRTLSSKAYAAANNVRKAVDAELKTVPEMAAADTKFAEKMKVRDALDYGNQFDKKTTYEQFAKEYNAASPEAKDAMRKGMTTRIHDYLDSASAGELSGFKQLFGKKAVNRQKLQLVFGPNADEALDALAKEAAFRASEKGILTGSDTASNIREMKYYGEHGQGNILSNAVKAAVLDATTGSPLIATGVNAIRTIGHGTAARLLKVGSQREAASTADLLSRQSAQRDAALATLTDVRKIQDRAQPQINLPRLPTAGIPFLNEAYNKLNEQ